MARPILSSSQRDPPPSRQANSPNQVTDWISPRSRSPHHQEMLLHPQEPSSCQKKPPKLRCPQLLLSCIPMMAGGGGVQTSVGHHRPPRGGTQTAAAAQFGPKPNVFSPKGAQMLHDLCRCCSSPTEFGTPGTAWPRWVPPPPAGSPHAPNGCPPSAWDTSLPGFRSFPPSSHRRGFCYSFKNNKTHF